MGRKVKGASALSLAVMAGIALFGFEGTRANAEMGNYVPVEAIEQVTQSVTEAQDDKDTPSGFVSQPVVQTIPETPEVDSQNAVPMASNLGDYLSGIPTPANLDKQLNCLAGAIYHESKGEPLDGQLAVARVIVARAESPRFPSSYCGVVFQRHQFSFVRGKAMPAINKSSRAWQRAQKLALIADQDGWKSEAEGALYFHANYVKPRWSSKMTRLAQIDNHIFYR
ncbi:MAG: cell wall hydrolase [Croceicoccus sp.]|nr:cell wall hydrolase [Croceicoccus sp.]MAL26277.1 cell wall hydrolase [Croceicoccus sp.]|tara:strand:+ start:95220 stop:95894 length:675 start_codon:yes stop_codon:yes gene_type:complete